MWEYPVTSRWEVVSKWYQFAEEAMQKKLNGEFDEVYLTQVYPGFPGRFYDSLRESMFRGYGEITIPIETELILSAEEVINVQDFAKLHGLDRKANVILFECSPESGQSFVTTEFALKVAEMIVGHIYDSAVILSGSSKIKTNNPNIIDGSVLTFRETSEITEYCTMFIGTGSGITQLTRTSWSKPLQTIQLLKKRTVASIIWDRKRRGLDSPDVIEMTDCSASQVYNCVVSGMVVWEKTKEHFSTEIIPDFAIIRFHMRFDKAKREGDWLGILFALSIAVQDYGLSRDLFEFFMTFPESIWKLVTRKIQGIT